MTKAVLRSRWCTDRWAVEFSQNLLDVAMHRLSQRTDLNSYVRQLVRNYQAESSATATSAGYESANMWRQTVADLDCYHPLHLELTTTETETGIFFADDTDDENSITVFEFTMTFCGAGMERHEQLRPSAKYDSGRGLKPVDEPFSVFVNSIITSTMDTDEKQRDEFWTDLGRIYTGPLQDMYGECERPHWRFNFRQQVAVDYFLAPERLPFRISSEIFRQAIRMDLDVHFDSYYYGISAYVPRYVHHLFEIDPTSLPREDPVVVRWASNACYRIRLFAKVYQGERLQRLDDGEDEPWPGRANQRRKQVLAKYTFDVEVRMVRYIKTGQSPYPPDDPAPHLQNAITQLGEILGPALDVATEDERLPEAETDGEEEQLIPQSIQGPNPPELSFLDQDDYRESPRGTEDEKDDDQTSTSSSSPQPRNVFTLDHLDDSRKPPEGFENGSFTIEVVKDPVESVLPSLDRIGLELRQRGKIYWLSPDDCKIPAQFVDDYKWYKKPVLMSASDGIFQIMQ